MRIGIGITALLAAVLVGCGGDGLKRVGVKGKVTAKGQPVDGATVQFIPVAGTPGEGGMGRTESDGTYTIVIGSRQGDSGVVPGDYKVRISRLINPDGSVLPGEAKEADYPRATESIPAPYFSLEGTTLKVKVPEGGGNVDIDMPTKLRGKK